MSDRASQELRQGDAEPSRLCLGGVVLLLAQADLGPNHDNNFTQSVITGTSHIAIAPRQLSTVVKSRCIMVTGSLDGFLQEWRYAARRLRRSPGFFVVVTLLIALGICANTVIFSFVDAVFLRPLPVREPEGLVQLFQIRPSIPAQPDFEYAFFDLLSRNVQTIKPVFGSVEFTTSLGQRDAASRVHVEAVTSNYFQALGVQPIVGRLPESDRNTAVVSHRAWMQNFGGDPGVVGRAIRLGANVYEITGVMPRGFHGTRVDTSADFFIAYEHYRESSTEAKFTIISILGRLPQGVSLEQAGAQARAVWASFWNSQQRPLTGFDRDVTVELRSVERGTSQLRDGFGRALILLLAASGLLLLMVSLNVGSLLFARVAAEEKHTAVRLAVGATRGRLACTRLFEIALISLMGGAGGIVLASAAIPLFLQWLSSPSAGGLTGYDLRPLTLDVTIGLRVIGFTIATVIVTMSVAALAPVYRVTRCDLRSVLNTGMGDVRHRRLQSSLIAVQVGLCTILLITGGLMLRTLSKLRAIDPGFDKESLVMVSIEPGIARYDAESKAALADRLPTEVKALPGVQNVALSGSPVMLGMGNVTFAVFPGRRLESSSWNTNINKVSPEYFETMGIRLLAGEIFSRSKPGSRDEPIPVVVNESFVHRVAADQTPIGLVFDQGSEYKRPQFRIVGLVRDANYRSLRETSPPIFYENFSSTDVAFDSFVMYVRTRSSPEALIEPVRALIGSIDPTLPVVRATTMASEVNRSLWRERLLEKLTVFYSVFALALVALGLYGILSHYVSSRRPELGLRVALGAGRRRIIWTVSRRVFLTVVSGAAGGVAAHLAAGSWIQTLLFGVPVVDAPSIAGAIMLVAAISAAAAALPAARAILTNPATALRHD
jgi:predicted permease